MIVLSLSGNDTLAPPLSRPRPHQLRTASAALTARRPRQRIPLVADFRLVAVLDEGTVALGLAMALQQQQGRRLQLGAGDTGPGPDVHQLAALYHGRLEQLSAHQHAALGLGNADLQRRFLGWYAQRAVQSQAGGDPTAQLAAVRDFKEAELRAYCHATLLHIAKQARAYEYLFLREYTGLDLDRLRARRMTVGEYLQFLERAEADLRAAFDAAVAQYTNAGGSCFSHTAFQLAELPAAAESFTDTGQIMLDIQLPQVSMFYGVTFRDLRVFRARTEDLPPSRGG